MNPATYTPIKLKPSKCEYCQHWTDEMACPHCGAPMANLEIEENYYTVARPAYGPLGSTSSVDFYHFNMERSTGYLLST